MSTPLLENILAQPEALRRVAAHQLGPGRSDLEAAAGLLRRAKRVIVTGMGASFFAAMPLPYVLHNAAVIESGELLHALIHLIQPETALVIVSRSGESVEILRLLELVAERSCSVVGITNVPDSTLAKRSSATLLLNSPADQMVAVQTYAASLATVLLVAAAVAGELGEAGRELEAAVHLLTPWIPELVAASPGLDPFASLTSALYILGRGANLTSVSEGMLLMHETGKAASVGMSVAQFRHGFVEAVDQQFRAVVVGTEPATQALDRQFAVDLSRMGAHVRWIGPGADSLRVHPLGHWPGAVPHRFRQLFEIVPLQLLAYRTATVRGIVPGEFRWSGLVTASESGFPGLDTQPPENHP